MKTRIQMIICGLLLAGWTTLQAQQSRVMSYPPGTGGSNQEGFANSFIEFRKFNTNTDSLLFLVAHNPGSLGRIGNITKLNPDLSYAPGYPQRVTFQLTNANGAIIQNLTNYVFSEGVLINNYDPTKPQQLAIIGYRGYNPTPFATMSVTPAIPFVAVVDIKETTITTSSAPTINVIGQIYDLLPDSLTYSCSQQGFAPQNYPLNVQNFFSSFSVGIKYIPPSNSTPNFACLAVVVNGMQLKNHSGTNIPAPQESNTVYLFKISPNIDPVSGLYQLSQNKPFDMYPGMTTGNQWLAKDMDVADGYLYTISRNTIYNIANENVITRTRIITDANQMPTLDPNDHKYISVQPATGYLSLHKLLVTNSSGRIYLGGNYHFPNDSLNGILISFPISNFSTPAASPPNVTYFKPLGNNSRLTNMTFDDCDVNKMVINFEAKNIPSLTYRPAIIQYNLITNTITPILNATSKNAIFFNVNYTGSPNDYLQGGWNSLIISKLSRSILFCGTILGAPYTFSYQNYTSQGLRFEATSNCVSAERINISTSPIINLSFQNRTFAPINGTSVCQRLRRSSNSFYASLPAPVPVCVSLLRLTSGPDEESDSQPTRDSFLNYLKNTCETRGSFEVNPNGMYSYSIIENHDRQTERLLLNGKLIDPCDVPSKIRHNQENTIVLEAARSCGQTLKREQYQFIATTEPMMEVYPNPATDHFTIVLTNGMNETSHRYELNDIYGKMVQTGVTTGASSMISTNTLSAGAYYLSIIDNSEKRYVQKLVISK